MLLSEKFDRTLWLLMASSEEAKNNIGDLISYLPKEMYDRIRRAISEYYKNGIKNNSGNIIFAESFIGEDKFEFYVRVELVNDELKLKVRRWIENKERIEEDYELNLLAISYKDLIGMDMADKSYMGSYSHEFNYIKFVGDSTLVDTENVDRDYNITRGPFGYKLSSSLGRRVYGMRIVNVLKRMPREIYYEDFTTLDNVDALVKRRVRRK